MNSLQSGLADFIANADVSDDVLDVAQLAMIDACAAILSGTTSELAQPLLDFAIKGAPGASVIIGTELALSPDRAALVNGTLGHAMDFDDTVSSMPGHPGVVTLSALLADLPTRPVSGRELLEAFAVGYEIATKMGAAIGMGHYNLGWHSTGSIGVFGAFAAAARLHRMPTSQIAAGLGLTTSLASGLRVNFGTMTKPLHSGWAASAGLAAAQLAASGVTGHARALDGPGGFFEVYGTSDSRPEALVDSLGSPYTMISPGISLKKYPCCFALHRAIDALESIRREVSLTPETVASIRVSVAPGSLKPVPYLRPQTGFEARFSMPYVLAVGAVDGRYGMEAFTDEAVRRPEVQDLLGRVSAVEDPACSPGDPLGVAKSAGTRGHVAVQVELADGRTIERLVEKPPGSPDRPLSLEAVIGKFHACASASALGAERVGQALKLLTNLRDVIDVHDLIPALVPDAASAASSAVAERDRADTLINNIK